MAIKDASLVSSQALHAYGSFLEKSKDDMVVLINSINTETRRISEEWDDKENQKFIDEFDTYISQIVNVVELLDNHSKFVHRKARAIENYHNI